MCRKNVLGYRRFLVLFCHIKFIPLLGILQDWWPFSIRIKNSIFQKWIKK